MSFGLRTAVFLALCVAPGVGIRARCQAVSPPSSVEGADGAAVFRTTGCPQCHMVKGSGGIKGPDLTKVGSRLSQSALEYRIVHGGGAMPAYGEVLTVDEIERLARYLHTLR